MDLDTLLQVVYGIIPQYTTLSYKTFYKPSTDETLDRFTLKQNISPADVLATEEKAKAVYNEIIVPTMTKDRSHPSLGSRKYRLRSQFRSQ